MPVNVPRPLQDRKTEASGILMTWCFQNILSAWTPAERRGFFHKTRASTTYQAQISAGDQETPAFVQKGLLPRSQYGSEPKHDYKCPINSPSSSFLSLSGSQSARWTHSGIRCAWEMLSSVPAFQTAKVLDPSGGNCSLKISYLEGHLGGSVS